MNGSDHAPSSAGGGIDAAGQAFDFASLVDLCRRTHEEMQGRAARAVDAFLVMRNWLFGWYIVEYENGGAERKELYGKQLIEGLADALKRHGLKGTSPTKLRKCREFYTAYWEIEQTLPVKSLLEALPSPDSASQRFVNSLSLTGAATDLSGDLLLQPEHLFKLGWSHYVVLLTVDNTPERRFYEIEAATNGWNVRELERQIASSLYERLALSRDKDEIRRLAREGQVVEKAADLIKNPLVLEFLGLEEKPVYSESELEKAIIDQLERFLS